ERSPRLAALEEDNREQHECADRRAQEHDPRRGEVVEPVLDEEIRAAPQGGQCAEQSRLARGQSFLAVLLPPESLALSAFFSLALASVLSAPSLADASSSRLRLRVP